MKKAPPKQKIIKIKEWHKINELNKDNITNNTTVVLTSIQLSKTPQLNATYKVHVRVHNEDTHKHIINMINEY
jgi:hypothetical protein